MGFGELRSIIRPITRTLLSSSNRTVSSFPSTSTSQPPELRLFFGRLRPNLPWIPPSNALHSLTETRFPKRRPSDKPRRKRASLKPPGPYAWVKYVPGQPILPSNPNEGSVKRRNEKKRIKQHRAFILGPYAWVKYVPGQPILPNNPNEGSVKRRNEKKRIKQHRAFILAEKKKRKAQLQEANRKKLAKRVERKMAAVARERAWAERLAELQRHEEEKKKAAVA